MDLQKKQKKRIKHYLALILCIALMFESTGLQVLASSAGVSEESTNTADTMNVGDDSGTGTTDGGTTDGDKEIIASGVYYGMDWTIDEDGLLIISGVRLQIFRKKVL